MNNEERKFLHDITSPITTIQLTLENLASTLEEQKNAALTQHMTMVQSCLRNTSKLAEMIHARRAILIQNEKK